MSSRCEAHVDAQWGHNTRCVGRVSIASVGLEKVRLSVGQVKTEKVRLSGREHLAGVQREIKTRCVGQVKTGKVSLSGREHLAGVQREIKTRCVGQVKTEKTEKYDCLAGSTSSGSDGRSRLTVGQVKTEM